MTGAEVALAVQVTAKALEALATLLRAGHPNPSKAVEDALQNAVELAAQERAQKQYG